MTSKNNEYIRIVFDFKEIDTFDKLKFKEIENKLWKIQDEKIIQLSIIQMNVENIMKRNEYSLKIIFNKL